MGPLTLEQASFVAEIVGVFAVVFSLVYVGHEVRASTNTMRVGAAQAFAELYNTFTNSLSSDGELADIWLRGIRDFDSLDEVERVRFSAQAAQCCRVFESAHNQYIRGALEDDMWKGFVPAITDVMNTPGMSTWWRHRKNWHSLAYQDLVHQLSSPKENRSSMYEFAD